MTKILGMDSANAKAKEMPYCSNMTISAALVIEMSNRIAELERSIIKQGGLHAHRTEKLAETTTKLVYSYKRIAELENVVLKAIKNSKEVLTNSKNTSAVRKKFEVSGSVKHYILNRKDFNSLRDQCK